MEYFRRRKSFEPISWRGQTVHLQESALKGRNETTKVEAATLIRVSRVGGESHQLIKRTCIVVFLRDIDPLNIQSRRVTPLP